jgi:hypothetical protein
MVGFYARFIPTYSSIAALLHNLKRKGIAFVLEDEHEKAVDLQKQDLCEAPLLQIPDFKLDFVLVTDASYFAVSVIFHQRVNGRLVPISYYSRLTAPERKYSTCEKVFGGIVGL